MMQQLLPLLRFDGYHVLADLTGVPDLYHRIRPTLLGTAAAPLERPGEPGAQAVGPRRHHALGAGDRPDDGADAASRWSPPCRGSLGTAAPPCGEDARPWPTPGRRRTPRRGGAHPPGPGGRPARARLRPHPRPRGPALVPGAGTLEPRLRGERGSLPRRSAPRWSPACPGPGGRTPATTGRSSREERGILSACSAAAGRGPAGRRARLARQRSDRRPLPRPARGPVGTRPSAGSRAGPSSRCGATVPRRATRCRPRDDPDARAVLVPSDGTGTERGRHQPRTRQDDDLGLPVRQAASARGG